jgi:hypothetical protein
VNDSESKTWYQGIGGRKYLLIWAVFLFGATCLVVGIDPDKDWLDFLKWALGMYFGANVGVTGIQGWINRNKPATPTDTQALIAQLQAGIDQLKTQLPKT